MAEMEPNRWDDPMPEEGASGVEQAPPKRSKRSVFYVTATVIALALFWCMDKRTGYYMLSVGFVGTIANQFMKLWFRIPRPWVIDENFTILEQAREGASGYSFPSGHTQSSVGTFGSIAYTTKNKAIRAVAIAIAILVPFSRMYIGVHTPLDVLVAAAMAVALIFLLHPVFFKKDGKYLYLSKS